MNQKTFEKIVSEFLQKEEHLLGWKAKEYSAGVDRLQNFREVAFLTGTKMSEVCISYLLKHIQSIANQVKTGRFTWEWTVNDGEGLKQRIADAVNYLHLLAACIESEVTTKQSVGLYDGAPQIKPPVRKM